MKRVIKDEIWRLRSALTPPNFAVLYFLYKNNATSSRNLYKNLLTKFTRKTLIISIRTLLSLGLIEPKTVKSDEKFSLGYGLTALGKEIVETSLALEEKIK